jgi:L-aminopeptidase/D-esterase-like protein
MTHLNLLPQTDWDAAPRTTTRSSFADLEINDDAARTPTSGSGRDVVEFDFPGVRVGTAEYADGPTGVTVVEFDGGARTAIDDRGGAVGITGRYGYNSAIALTGGSVQGLAAASGVTDAIMAEQGRKTGFADLVAVSGACIYDFAVRDNAIVPDNALGRAAHANARAGQVPIGRVGAGVAASCGKMSPSSTEWAGQGAAFVQVGDLKVLAIVVVTAGGVVLDRDGRVLRGNLQSDGTRRHPITDSLLAFDGEGQDAAPAFQRGNTTISTVVTNAKLNDIDLRQLATQVHSSMHRAIQPFHTALDGDTLFLATTDEVELPSYDPRQTLSPSVASVGAIASEVMWNAIIESAR